MLKEGVNRIGKADEGNPPDIKVDGLGVGINHCQLVMQDGEAMIIPSQDTSLKTMVNGKIITAQTKIDHEDRIRFGNHVFFLYVDPDDIA
jgi:hypothetical protein